MSDRLADIKARIGVRNTLGIGRAETPYDEVAREVIWLVDEVERLTDALKNIEAAHLLLHAEAGAERIENARLREAFMVMERGYNLAAAVLDTCADLGITYPNMDTNLIHLMANRAAWEAWKARGKG